MKNRIVIDLSVFNAILRELKSIRKELREGKGEAPPKPLPKRELEDAMTTPEVLKLLKISPMTLINYEKKGLIKYHKEGRSKIYSRAEIVAFRKSRGRRKRISKLKLRELQS